MEEIDSIENKKRIYSHIKRKPGSHLRGISRDLDLGLSTIRHHIGSMEKSGLVTSRKEGNLKVFFCSDDVGGTKRRVFPLLQQKRFRDIILVLLLGPGSTPSSISEKLDLNPSTLSKYLGILESREMVRSRKEGRVKFYYLTQENEILTFLISYQGSFLDRLVDNALDIYFDR